MPVVSCPGCAVKIKVPDGKFGRFRCPKCEQPIVIPAPAGGPAVSAPAPSVASQPGSAQPLPSWSLPPTDPLSSFGTSNAFPSFPASPANGGFQPPSQYAAVKRPASNAASGALIGFVKRLAIGVGAFCVVLLVLGAVGLASEPVALGACLLGCAACLGLVVWGRIWMIVLAFQETVVQGLLVLFVPYYWLIYPATRKGQTLRPLAVVVSALAPVLVCLGLVAVLMPKHQRGANFGGASRPGLARSQIATLESQIQQMQANSPESQVLRTVSFPKFTQVGGTIDPARAEQVLAKLPGYVPGSFRVDEQARIVTFQFRGPPEAAQRMGLILASEAKVMIGVAPTFHDGPIAPSAAPGGTPLASGVPTNGQSAPTPPADSGLPVPASQQDVLRTVSFQTLGPVNVPAGGAEQALASVPGYLAGSFRVEPESQRVTLQYRGPESAAIQIGLLLQQRLQIVVRLKPEFSDSQ